MPVANNTRGLRCADGGRALLDEFKRDEHDRRDHQAGESGRDEHECDPFEGGLVHRVVEVGKVLGHIV